MNDYYNNRFLTVEEVASLLRKKERTIREWCYCKTIPHYKVGNSLLFKKNEILNWIEKNYRVEISSPVNNFEKTNERTKQNTAPPRLQVKEEVENN